MLYEDFQDYFTKRLIQLRMKKGVSAQGMSLAIGQSKGYIAQIERKHNLPSMEVFLYICEYLGVTMQEFLNEDIKYPAMYNELFGNLKELNEEQITNINNIVKNLLRK